MRALLYAKKPVAAVMMRSIADRLAREYGMEIHACSRLFGRSDAGAIFEAAGLPGTRAIAKWRARLTRFDLYLSADFGIVAPRARVKVHTFHGVSFRNHAVNQAALRYDLLLVPGPYMRRQFESLGIVTALNEKRFPITGMPKLDALVDGTLRRANILSRLRLDPSQKTVLFAPTWSKKFSSLEVHGDRMIEALRALPYNVIVKLHDNSRDLRKATRDWAAAFRAIANDRLTYVEEPDIVPLMVASDAIVSDASSTANEFTLLDRPIVFVATPHLEQKVKAKADLETWGQKAGAIASRPEDLRDVLEHEFGDPQRLAPVRQALARDLFHDPGNATKNAVNAIRALLQS